MAEALSHTPRHVDHQAAKRQLDDLVAALEESGLLRALTGAVRQYPQLAAEVAKRIDPNRATGAAAVTGLLSVPDAEDAHRVAAGLRAAGGAADRALAARSAPGLLQLVRRLGDADVRRGLAAALDALSAFGAAVSRPR